MRKLKPKVQLYTIVQEAVENGVAIGWRHAFKHTDKPDADRACDEITREVLLALDEVLRWE